jgi:integrase
MPYTNKQSNSNKYPWIGQVKISGRKKRKLCTTKKQALEWEAEQRKQKVLLTNTVSLAEWAIKYLDFSRETHAQKTYKEEKQPSFKRLFKYSGFHKNEPVEVITPESIRVYLRKLARYYEASTVNKDRKNLSAAWNWAIKNRMKVPPFNPFTVVDKMNAKKKGRYVPPLEDFWAVYNVAYCSQDKRMLLTYFHTGARKEELFRLKWVDVDFINRKVRLYSRKNKGGKWVGKWLPMSVDCHENLRAQFKLSGKKDYVFVDEQSGLPFLSRMHWLRRLSGFAQVKYFDFHSIRHLTAVTLYKAGVSLSDIQVILRHEKATTTDAYLKSLMEIEEGGREALESLPGPGSFSSLSLNGKKEKAHQKAHQVLD